MRIFRAIVSAPVQFADWAADPATPAWKPALAGLAVLAVIVAAVVMTLVLTHASAGCPAGQHLTVTTWYPLQINGVTTLQPVYGCTG